MPGSSGYGTRSCFVPPRNRNYCYCSTTYILYLVYVVDADAMYWDSKRLVPEPTRSDGHQYNILLDRPLLVRPGPHRVIDQGR